MPALQLPLVKEGDLATKLSLNLDKGEMFRVRLSWDGDADLDLHALVAVNTGAGAKVHSMEDILSTYNVQRVLRGQTVGSLVKAADGSFQIHNGALVHSPDATDGNQHGDDEYVLCYPDKLTPPANGGIEIPLVVMIHPQSSGKTFRNVRNARVIIENGAGTELVNVSLTEQFADNVGVQMGSVLVQASQSEYSNLGVGFNQDFNQVLAHFS